MMMTVPGANGHKKNGFPCDLLVYNAEGTIFLLILLLAASTVVDYL